MCGRFTQPRWPSLSAISNRCIMRCDPYAEFVMFSPRPGLSPRTRRRASNRLTWTLLGIAMLFLAITIYRLRHWSLLRDEQAGDEESHLSSGTVRPPWSSRLPPSALAPGLALWLTYKSEALPRQAQEAVRTWTDMNPHLPHRSVRADRQ